MSTFKKNTAYLLIIVLLLSFTTAFADNNIFYEETNEDIITQDVTHKNIIRFTEEGWLNINIIEADLCNPYLDLKLLTDSKGTSYLNDIKDLSKDKNTVASINGDFFQRLRDHNDRGSAIGPVIIDGRIISSAAHEDGMATAVLDKNKKLFFDYIDFEIKLTAPNGKSTLVKHINKYDPLDSIVIYDSNWAEYSLGSYDNKVEVIVEENEVKEIRREKDSVKISENGYIICNLPEYNSFLIDNLKVGDKIDLDINCSIDTREIKYAFGAGSILVKDGKPHDITHNIKGLHPRTVIGTDKRGEKVYFITIDGRQLESKGMTLEELSDFLVEQGIYSAVNLDGGGSTSMLAKSVAESNLQIINKVSDGWLRNIANAVAVTSNAPKTNLYGLIIKKPTENVFVNTSIELDIKGHDKYYNPYNIDINDINWSCEGINGYFKENIFYPTSVGSGYIKASLNGITAKTPIDVLSTPQSIKLEPKKIVLSKGHTAKIKITGKNKYGYSAPINISDVNIFTEKNIVSINKDGILTAEKSGISVITASINDVTSNGIVAIDSTIPVYEFENKNASFLPYPSYIKGSYSLSSDYKKSGNSSGKLTYDFTMKENDSKAAYIKFDNDGILINDNVTKIGMWVHASDYMQHWLRGMIKGPDNKPVRIEFSRKIDWNGWKYVEAEIPKNVQQPMYLTRLYIVQIDPEIKNKGSLYFDDLTFIYENSNTANIEIPEDIKKPDKLNKPYNENNNGFTFSVFGDTISISNLLDNLIMSKLIFRLNNYSQLAGFVSDIDENTISNLEIPYFETKGHYIFEKKGNTFMYLDSSDDGFRRTDSSQWEWFINNINKIDTDNVFIFLPNPLEGENGFTDNKEAQLFKDMLTENLAKEGKTVFVFYNDNKTNVEFDRGVRYISLPGIKDTDMDNITRTIEEYNYALVTIENGNVSYDIKNLFE